MPPLKTPCSWVWMLANDLCFREQLLLTIDIAHALYSHALNYRNHTIIDTLFFYIYSSPTSYGVV